MTGRFPARDRIHGPITARAALMEKWNQPKALDPDLPTVIDLLSEDGYVTGHFGKWHLGYDTLKENDEKYNLDKYGFDEFKLRSEDWDIWRNRPESSKMVLEETFKFVDKHKDEPFYVQAWFADPHATLDPSDEQMDVYDSIYFNPRGTDHRSTWEIYGGTVTEMDKQIGIFLDKISELGLDKDTYVIFSSDNGPEDIHVCNATHSGVGSPGPFRGRKRSIYEGGIRVPLIVRRPGKIPAGKVNNESVIAGVDFLPTICSLANIGVPAKVEHDGEDMSEAIHGKEIKRTKPLMWEWRWDFNGYKHHCSPILAIREGKWKLLINPDGSRVELYDILSGPMEVDNLADQNSDVVKRLSKKVLAWKKGLPESPIDPKGGNNEYPWPVDYPEQNRIKFPAWRQ